MNFTLDDTSSQLVYSPNSWGIQLGSDPYREEFFEGTYHAAEADGASVNMSITGSAFYIYGSKGPGHGNVSVQYDNAIIILSAYADQTSYRQLLYHHDFDPTIKPPHFLSVVVRLSGDGVRGQWFDFDYITFTDNSNATNSSSPNGLQTAIPPWQTASSTGSGTSTALPSSLSNVTTSGSSTGSTSAKPSKTTTILASLFGSIILLFLLIILSYFALRKIYDSRRDRERSFRYGSFMRRAAATPSMRTNDTGTTAGASSSLATGAPQAKWKSVTGPDVGGNGSSSNLFKDKDSRPMSPGISTVTSISGSGSGATPATGSVTSNTGLQEKDKGEGKSGRETPFAFLSTAPVSFRFDRRGKGDADSLKTDFLQV